MLRLRKRGPPFVSVSDTQLYRDFVIHMFTARMRGTLETLRALIVKRRADRLTRTLDLAATTPARIAGLGWLELFEAVRSLAGDELRWKIAHAQQHLQAQQRGLNKLHRTRRLGEVRSGPHEQTGGSRRRTRARAKAASTEAGAFDTLKRQLP